MRLPIVLGIFAVVLVVLAINPSGYSQLKDAGGKLVQPLSLPPAGRATEHNGQGGESQTVEDGLDARPVVHRAGKLPLGLPPWFNVLDADGDGQVSLHEWRVAGKKLADFRKYDLDDDGLITVDEIRRTMKDGTSLRLVQGHVSHDGAIEDATGEKYRDKNTFTVFTIKLEAGKTYYIEHISPVFFAYLFLEDSNGEIVARHNGGGKGRAARIIHRAAKTEICRIIATSQDGYKSGVFFMSVRVLNGMGAHMQELPAWFRDLDTDHDGQIALHEWRKGGKKLADFRKHDRDGDGFITADEVLRPIRRPIELRLKQGQSNYKGTLEATDVRHQGKKLSKVFTVQLEAGQTYQFNLMSPAFDAYLYLEDSEGVVLAQNDDGGEGTNSRIVHEAAEDGTYRLIATSLSGNGVGAFTVSVRDVLRTGGIDRQELPAWFSALDTDHDGQVAFHEWREGRKKVAEFRKYDLDGDGFITPEEVLRVIRMPRELKLRNGEANYKGDLEATDVRYRSKKLTKIFNITLKAGRTYQFDYLSKAYDAYLYLADADGNVLARDDDGGGGTNSRIVYQAAEDGTYRLIATSASGNRVGAFSVSVRALSGSGQDIPKGLPSWFHALDTDRDGQVSLEEWRDAKKPLADFRKYDLDDDGLITADEIRRTMRDGTSLRLQQGQASYDGEIEDATGEKYREKKTYKAFTVKLEAGKTYQIEHVSQVFFAYLYLEDSSGEVLAKNNSGGKGQVSRIVHHAARSGIYHIIATSQDGYKTGAFSMSIRVLDAAGPFGPLDLPAWFKDLDTDHDGQVALYEWRKAGKALADFRLYDLDDDGFITPEEMFRYMQVHSETGLKK